MGQGWRFRGNEKKYIDEVLESGELSPSSGDMVHRLERAFAEKFGVKYAIAVNSGTSTIHCALAAAGVGPGDEVIVPAYTVMGTIWPVVHHNAVPVIVDVDYRTRNIAPAEIKKKITPRTKAIIPVHISGLPCEMDEIMEIAEEHNLYVIGDCAQCYLGYYKGKLAGTIEHMASFSLEQSKFITSGEGGLVVTNDEKLGEIIRKVSSVGYGFITALDGRLSDPMAKPLIERLGWNYRMPELSAAVALAQLERLEEFVNAKVEVSNRYNEVVKGCDWLTTQYVPEYIKHCYWHYILLVEEEQRGISREKFINKFQEYGGSGCIQLLIVPYLHPAMKSLRAYGKEGCHCPFDCERYAGKVKYEPGLCPNAEAISQRACILETRFETVEESDTTVSALKKTIDFFGK